MKILLNTTFLFLFLLHQLQAQDVKWLKSVGGNDFDFIFDIKTAANSDVVYGGQFIGAADYDPDPTATLSVTSQYRDAYVSRLDPDGNLLWFHKFDGASFEEINKIAFDNQGNIYVTGIIGGSTNFDPGGSNTTITPSGIAGFIAKFTAGGNFVWVKHFDPYSGNSKAFAIDLDSQGNIYVGGSFTGSIEFDPNNGSTILSSPSSNDDGFVCKLDPSGNLLWAKRIGGSSSDGVEKICVAANNDVYLKGHFGGTVDFDPSSNVNQFTSNYPYGNFAMKMTNTGNYVWAKQFGAIEDMAIDQSSNIYYTGFFFSTIDTDPSSTTTHNLTALNNADAHLTKLDPNGNHLWSKQLMCNDAVWSKHIVINSSNDIYIGGYFKDSMDVDFSANTELMVPAGGSDVFVLKYNANGTFLNNYKMGHTDDEDIDELAVSNSGQIYFGGLYFNTMYADSNQSVTAVGSYDIYLSQFNVICNNTTANLNVQTCYQYTAPSGNYTWTQSGIYQDTITNSNGCDSILTIDVTISGDSYDTLYVSSCNTYTHNGQQYNSSGVYQQTLTSTAGCDSLLTIIVAIQTLDINITQVGNMLEATVPNLSSYQWYDCNGSAIANATSQSFTPTNNGLYQVVGANTFCTDTSACFSFVLMNTTTTLETAPAPIIAPNPNDGNFQLLLQEDFSTAMWTITDLSGKIIQQQTTTHATSSIPITLDNPAGIYILAIQIDNQPVKHFKIQKF